MRQKPHPEQGKRKECKWEGNARSRMWASVGAAAALKEMQVETSGGTGKLG